MLCYCQYKEGAALPSQKFTKDKKYSLEKYSTSSKSLGDLVEYSGSGASSTESDSQEEELTFWQTFRVPLLTLKFYGHCLKLSLGNCKENVV